MFLSFFLNFALLAAVPVAVAKRPGNVWISNLNAGIKMLFEGDRLTMADFFTSEAHVCFNGDCGGALHCAVFMIVCCLI